MAAFLGLGLAAVGWGGGGATDRDGGGAAGRDGAGEMGCVVAQGSFEEEVFFDFILNRNRITTQWQPEGLHQRCWDHFCSQPGCPVGARFLLPAVLNQAPTSGLW